MLRIFEDLINENQTLKERLRLMEETLDEFEGQRNEIFRIVATDQMALASTGKLEPDPSTMLSPRSYASIESDAGDTWLMKAWLSTSKSRHYLGSIEDLWTKQKHQSALKELEKLLFREDITTDVRINAKLLQSCILRDNGQAARALIQAKEALDITKRYDAFYDLRGKARFHVGLCYFEVGKFKEAEWSFCLASYAKGHASEVEMWKTLAQDELQKLR